jgi:hypothetical protein
MAMGVRVADGDGSWVPHPAHFYAQPNWAIFNGRPITDPVSWSWSYQSAHGYLTTLSWDVQHRGDLIFLDWNKDVQEIYCNTYSVTVKVTSEDVVANWTSGSLMVGGAEWGCLNEQGKVGPLYRTVLYSKRYYDDETCYYNICYEIYVAYGAFAQAFNYTRIHLVTSQVAGASEWVTKLNNNPISQPIEEPNFNYTVGTNISWNYDPQTGQAKQMQWVFYQDSHFDIYCEDCYTIVGATLDFELDTSWPYGQKVPEADKFAASITGYWKANIDLVADASAKYKLDKALQLLSFNIDTLYFTIGMIPIFIDVDLALVVSVTVDFSAHAVFNAGFSVDGDIDAGIEWTPSSGWSVFGDYTGINLVYKDPTFQDAAELTAAVTIDPQLQFNFYDIGGPYFELLPGMGLTVDLQQAKLCWALYHLFGGGVGAELAIPWHIQTDPLMIWNHKFDQHTGCLPGPVEQLKDKQ